MAPEKEDSSSAKEFSSKEVSAELRGSLVSRPDVAPESKLRSTVRLKEEAEAPALPQKLQAGAMIMNRDSGVMWRVADIVDDGRGNKLAHLKALDDSKGTFTTKLDRLQDHLSTEGYPWHW